VSQLVIFVGLPGSGKSTYYAAHFSATHVQVSKDLLGRGKSADTKMMTSIRGALAAGKSVVVDNTNAAIAVRAPVIALGKQFGAQVIAYYFDCPPKIAVARNAQREGKAKVPRVAIFVTAKKLQAPKVEEGFDEVHVVTCG
jgi:predicted kinase